MDLCGGVSVACVPSSGSTFEEGVTKRRLHGYRCAGNMSTCSFNVIVQRRKHTTPSRNYRTALRSTRRSIAGHTKRVIVTVQNRSAHSETITDLAQLTNLVTLAVQSLDTNLCADIVAVFTKARRSGSLPFTLKSKQTLKYFST